MTDNDSPVLGAIIHRIMVGRTDLLAKYGPQSILSAAEDVADWVGDVEEIGSSDVSGWVKQVERMLEENPPEAFGVKEDINPEDVGEYDREGDMAKSDLRSIMLNASRLHDMLGDSDNLPEWVQSKLTVAEDYLSTVVNYLSAQAAEPMADMPEGAVTEAVDSDLRSAVTSVIQGIYQGAQAGSDMIDDVADELGDYFDAVEQSNDEALQHAYSLMRDEGADAEGDPKLMASVAKRALAMLQAGESVTEGKTGNAGYDSMLAVMKAVDAGQDATFDIAGEPITLEYPEARFLAGKYKAFLKAGRQEEFLKYMENPVTFDRLMKQLRDLIDKQKNFRGSVPGERGVEEAAPTVATLAGGLGLGAIAAAGAPGIVAILGPLVGIPVAAYGAYSAAKLGMKGVEKLWDMATEKLGSSDKVEQYTKAEIAKLPPDEAKAAAAVVNKVAESKKFAGQSLKEAGTATHPVFAEYGISDADVKKAEQFRSPEAGTEQDVIKIISGLQGENPKLIMYLMMYGKEVADKDLESAKRRAWEQDQSTYKEIEIGRLPNRMFFWGVKPEKFGMPTVATMSTNEAAKNPYAIGMAQAMKSTGDTPPLKKSTIKKAHKIADAIKANESLAENEYWCGIDKKVKAVPAGYKKLASGYITRI